MEQDNHVRESLRELFGRQHLAVLATSLCEAPGAYTSLVGFAATEDLRHILFATARGTRKHRNIEACPDVSLLIDSRTNTQQDFQQAVAVTVVGRAEDTAGAERAALQKLYLARHPNLEDFVTDPACALLRVDVACYYHVSQFQNVTEFRP
jgi:nitroimidazol reductase NimA-like FMN-containing flavoprotein (pyridoxamine 5'-phosphate oxidase superfamily)